MSHLYWVDNVLYIKVHVQPGAKRTAIVGLHGDSIKIKVAAQPSDNMANEKLIEFISSCLDVAKQNVEIIRGGKSRSKLVKVLNPSKEMVDCLLPL